MIIEKVISSKNCLDPEVIDVRLPQSKRNIITGAISLFSRTKVEKKIDRRKPLTSLKNLTKHVVFFYKSFVSRTGATFRNEILVSLKQILNEL